MTDDHPDLFAPPPPKPQAINVAEARRHARECFYRFIGRYPMTDEERAEIRARKGLTNGVTDE